MAVKTEALKSTLDAETAHDVRNGRPRSAAGVGVIGLLVAAGGAFALAPLAMPDSYSSIELGLSEAAAQGVDGAWVARTGFILFGLAVVWLVQLRPAVWSIAGAVFHLAFGVSMFAVAAFAHKPWEQGAPFVESEDTLHTVFASVVGVGFIGGVICVMIARRHRTWKSLAPDVCALVVALAVLMAMSSGVWGVLQRLMFLTGACWYGREAWNVFRSGAVITTPARRVGDVTYGSGYGLDPREY